MLARPNFFQIKTMLVTPFLFECEVPELPHQAALDSRRVGPALGEDQLYRVPEHLGEPAHMKVHTHAVVTGSRGLLHRIGEPAPIINLNVFYLTKINY